MTSGQVSPKVDRGAFGARVRARREALGLLQREVREAVGFKTDKSVSQIERGRSFPKGETFTKLVQVLRVEADWLLYGTSPRAQDHKPVATAHNKESAACPNCTRPSAWSLTDGERAVWAAAFVADLQHMGFCRREVAPYAPDGPWGTMLDDVSSAVAVAQSVVEMLRDVAPGIADDYPTALEMVRGEHVEEVDE